MLRRRRSRREDGSHWSTRCRHVVCFQQIANHSRWKQRFINGFGVRIGGSATISDENSSESSSLVSLSPRAPKHIWKAYSLWKSSYDRLCFLRPRQLHISLEATCTRSFLSSSNRSTPISPPNTPPSPSTTIRTAPKAPKPPATRVIWPSSIRSRRLRACAARRECRRSRRRALSPTARCCCCLRWAGRIERPPTWTSSKPCSECPPQPGNPFEKPFPR